VTFGRAAEYGPPAGVNPKQMTLPTVTEIIRRPEATTRDTFVADLSPVPRPSGTRRAA
jgi:hypothetical protein